MIDFGKKIKMARELRRYSQAYVAQMVPMPQSSYSKIENNYQEPNLYQLTRIAQILQVSLDELFGLEIAHDPQENDNMIKDIKDFIRKYS